jgi:hypothetical protein
MKSLRIRRPSPAMAVAMLALLVAMSGTAGADPIGEVSALIRGKSIAANAITSKHVKNNSLVRRDFKRGQLPAGPRGPAGPAGATGATGPAGSQGPAGTARAYTNVKVDQPQQPTFNRNKGFSNARSPQVGVYCLIAPGLDPSSTMHMAGQWTDGTQFTGATVAADGGGQQCNVNEFQVNTNADSGAATTVVEFWVAIP